MSEITRLLKQASEEDRESLDLLARELIRKGYGSPEKQHTFFMAVRFAGIRPEEVATYLYKEGAKIISIETYYVYIRVIGPGHQQRIIEALKPLTIKASNLWVNGVHMSNF